MKFLSRVVWSEGMYLAPHHFQIQNRYFEDSISFRTQGLWRDCCGLLQVQLDRKAIENGRVALLHAAGIFTDGLVFDMPTSDQLPADRDLTQLFSSTATELFLHLAVSKRDDKGSSSRYIRRSQIVRDETNGVDEQNVEFAIKNIEIVVESELNPAMNRLPLARVVRDEHGKFVYDDEFVPACLRVSASLSLTRKLQRVIEVVGEKSAAIALKVQPPTAVTSVASPSDIACYWFLHSLQSTLPTLQHLLRTVRAHPADFFMELSRLAGALCTFAMDSDPRTLPAYDHMDPGPGFEALCAHIHRHLEIFIPSNFIVLPFSATGPYLWESVVTNERCLHRARWILGVRSSLGESHLLSVVPQLVKLCSAQFVSELVKRALPGMRLTHLPLAPSTLRVEPDMQYFSVDTTGPCWQHILHSRGIGIYIPGEITDADFTLTAIVEAQA